MGIKKSVNRGKEFVNKGVWDIEIENLGRIKRKIVQSIKVVMLTCRTFSAQKIGFQSVALSFFCTMAVVPAVAVALAITKGLGLSDKIYDILVTYANGNQEVIDNVMHYADNIILKASSSVLGAISAAFFVWLVIWMMLCVERVFNNVWKVEKGRSFTTRFWRDVAIVLISPFLMLLLYFGALGLSGALNISAFKWILIIVGSWFTFSAMYKFIPNTEVRYSNAAKAAIVSSLAFTAIQFVYVESQIFLTRLSGIYGAIAAIPFFMFWLNFSWYVILVGAELSYAFQNVNQYSIDNGQNN